MSGRTFLSVARAELHYRRLGTEFEGTPLVFLHEGLGSVELWREFADDLVARTRRPGLIFSRRGNGWSTPLQSARTPDYMHDEALRTLPEVLEQLVGAPPILIGHSDGASISIIYAGAENSVRALVLIAPHVLTEREGLEAIAAIRQRFTDSDLAERMAKYHVDPEATFYGWADVWLSPAFRSWNIEEYLPGVTCPTLVVQGTDDEYGTMRQIEAIEAGLVVKPQRLIVERAGHSPHLTDPDVVTGTVVDFIVNLDQ
ncbi:MAG TPA: alpha/beta hydrolase [Acidimicrobiia bacterium]|nr:alpha/beta hydrolase [Acidimicrobiia bacterium]